MTAHKNLARASLSQFTATSIAMEAQRWSTSWAIHFCDLQEVSNDEEMGNQLREVVYPIIYFHIYAGVYICQVVGRISEPSTVVYFRRTKVYASWGITTYQQQFGQ